SVARSGTDHPDHTARVRGFHRRSRLEKNGSLNGGLATRFLHTPLFRSRRALLILVLVLLGSFIVKPAYASTYVGYVQANDVGSPACTGNPSLGCFTCAADGGDGSKCGTGSAIQSPLAGTVTGISFYSADVAANQVVIATFPAGSVPSTTLTGPSCNGQSGPCLTVNSGQTFTVQDVEALSGVTTFTFTTVNLANPVSVSLNQFIAVQLMRTSGGAGSPHGLVGICNTSCASVTNTYDACIDFTTTSPVISSTYSETSLANCGPGLNLVTGATFTATGQSGNFVTVTQCYGNCGTPAITLANTNSSHTINFNQSITLFYEFQSNLNGFIINVTTSIAKTYSNGLGVVEAIYTVPSCAIGNTPFSSVCPGYLASGWNVVGNPTKGKLSNGNYLIPVSNGEWIGVSISATMSGLDLNDTNTNVSLF